jgi:hypothetical protein
MNKIVLNNVTKTILIPLILLGGLVVYNKVDHYLVLSRVLEIKEDRLEKLYNQLHQYVIDSDDEYFSVNFFGDEIPKEFDDIKPRRVVIHRYGAHVSFWFMMDEGIQYRVVGFDKGREPAITLLWGEGGRDSYNEKIVWTSKR